MMELAASSQSLHTNTSGYAFYPLTSLPTLRENLLKAHKEKYATSLMGTILLAVEGVNVRLSGSLSAVEEFKIIIESVLSLPSSLVHYKDSTSSSPSLPRFLVKIKKELIGMGMPSADPSLAPSPAQHISPEDLHSMLTSSTSDVVLLDTRNDYELKVRMDKMKTAHRRPYRERCRGSCPSRNLPKTNFTT